MCFQLFLEELKNLLDGLGGQQRHHAELIATLNQQLSDYKRCNFNISIFQLGQICDAFSRLLKLSEDIIELNKCSRVSEGLRLKSDELRRAYEDFVINTNSSNKHVLPNGFWEDRKRNFEQLSADEPLVGQKFEACLFKTKRE